MGIVHRNGREHGYEYIEVINDTLCFTEPIIEFRKESINTVSKLDEFYMKNLVKLGKSEKDIVSRGGSIIYVYFGEEVFHDLIYKKIEELFSELFNTK